MPNLTTTEINKLTAKDSMAKYYEAAWHDVFNCLDKCERERVRNNLTKKIDDLSTQRFVRQVINLAEEMFDKRNATKI